MFKLPFLKTKYFQPRFLMVVFLVVIVGFFFAGAANASIATSVATFLGWIIYGIVWALGQLLVVLMNVLVWIAQWSNFIYAPAVVLGWKIVRDICNMFFVVIMLIIAFATILRVKEYSYEKLLPKLIIMAILINFSKMICGLLIDVSQVVMLTFVNSFKDVAGGNLTTILGLDKITSMKDNSDAAASTGSTGASDVTGWSIMGAYVLALVYVIIALITIATMVIMLAIRIVMIWIYVVLSPMAYLLGAFPAGKKYSSKWWGDFTSNLIVGPVLAFFIWLSFAALGTGQDTIGKSGIDAAKPTSEGITSNGSSITEAGSPNNMLNFVISIAMLYGGLTVAKSIGGAAGGMASKGMGAISKGVVKPMAAGAMGAYAFSKRKAIAGGKFTGQSLKTGLGTLDRVAGAGIDKARMKINKDGVLTKTSLAQKGLISTGAAFAFNAPRKRIDSLKNKMAGDRDVKEKLLQYNEDEKRLGQGNAVMKDGNKQYKKDDKGKMREWDKEKNDWAASGEIYKDKNGKEVSANGLFADSFNQAVRKNFGKSEDKADKDREGKVSKIQEEMLASGMSEGEMLRRLQNGSTSANEKMALAMTLAIKGGFKDAAQVSLAKKEVGINPGLSKKFDDEVDKKQAHLAYDFNNTSDVAKFKKRVDTGKIDATRLHNDAYENPKIQQTLEEHYDAEEFGKIMASAISRGGRKTKAAIGKGTLENRRVDETGKITNSAAAVLHAKVTGDISESFSATSDSGEKKLDEEALKSFVGSAKASDLNKIDFAKLKELKDKAEKENNEEEKKFIKNIEDGILGSLTSAKLAAMNKDGGNQELVQHLVNLQAKNGDKGGASEEEKAKKEFIWNNKELSSLLNKENLDSKKAAEEAAEEKAKKAQEKSGLLDQFGNPIK